VGGVRALKSAISKAFFRVHDIDEAGIASGKQLEVS
jgi:hypothetical protein